MVFEEDLEGFAGDLTVEEKILMAGYKKDGSSAGLEVLQMTALNSPVDAKLLCGESVVVYLCRSQPWMQQSGRNAYLIPQLSWEAEEGKNMRWHCILMLKLVSTNKRHDGRGWDSDGHGACFQFSRSFRVANQGYQALPRSTTVPIFT
jgi:hypothetical protein